MQIMILKIIILFRSICIYFIFLEILILLYAELCQWDIRQ